MNESLDEQRKRLEADVLKMEQKIDFEQSRSGEIRQALNELTIREHKLNLDLEYMTHPGTSSRTSTAAESAIALSGVLGGIAELGRYERETVSRINDLLRDLGQLKDELLRL